jgi:predicted alpha/beta-hydrolase family hydrolase
MPRAAELVVNTRFNGRAVQQGLAQTKGQLDQLGSTLGGKLTSMFAAAFSAEKMLMFAKAIDAVARRRGRQDGV